MKRTIIIHYSEIGLKKANTPYFVEKLRRHIKSRLEKKFKKTFDVKYALGRILVNEPEGFDLQKKEAQCVEVIRKIFGIKNFKFCFNGSLVVSKLGAEIWKNMPQFEERPETFCVKVKRAMKMDAKSFEMARDLGAILLEDGIDMKVKLKKPAFTVDVEFFNNFGFFSFYKYEGAGGLTANSQNKLVSLISSGIDSPVASYMMMRRGARIIFVSFHGKPYTNDSELKQVKDLVEILSEYQNDTRLWLIPFGKFQKSIKENRDVPGKVRTVIYRRMMLRIAEKISKKKNAKGIVTGDNFGQVASQTPENLFAVHQASTIPVFQPLIGMDKEDIIRMSEKIGAFEISKLPCEESCVTFAPRSPELKANVHDLVEYEKTIDIEKWMDHSLENAELISF